MKALATINLIIFSIVSGLMVGWGLDLKKKTSWLLGIYAFISFLLLGLSNASNIRESVILSSCFSSLIVFGGAVMHWNRERSEKWLKDRNKEDK